MFTYYLECRTIRAHLNRPFINYHEHEFIFIVWFRAERQPSNIYGVDTVQSRQSLIECVDSLPYRINDHPDLKDGTTEQLCEWLLKFEFNNLKPFKVGVGEIPEAIVYLEQP